MKKTYVKPELDSRTFAQFENVFTACNKTKNNANCSYCHPGNPGSDSNPCPTCSQGPSAHAAQPANSLGS